MFVTTSRYIGGFVESCDLLTFGLLTLILWTTSIGIAHGLMHVHQAVSRDVNTRFNQLNAVAKLFAWIAFAVVLWSQAHDMPLNIEYLFEQTFRAFLLAIIAHGLIAVVLSLLFLISEWMRQKQAEIPRFFITMFDAFWYLRFLFPKRPKKQTQKEEHSAEETMLLRLEEARHEYEVKADSISDAGLDQIEVQAIRNQLKQEYLKRIRRTLRGNDVETTESA